MNEFTLTLRDGSTVVCDVDPVWVRKMEYGTPYYTAMGDIITGFAVGDAEDRPNIPLLEAYQRVPGSPVPVIRRRDMAIGFADEYFLYKEGFFVGRVRIRKQLREMKNIVSQEAENAKRFPTSRRAINMAKKIGFDAYRGDGLMLFRAADGFCWNV